MKRIVVGLALLLAGSIAVAAPRALVADGSEVGFTAKQMGVSVSGRFTRFEAKVDLDASKPEGSNAEVSVDTGSLSTGDPDADGTAKDKPWLDVADFPRATFKSSAIKALAGGRYEVKGMLTLRGKPRAISVPFTLATAADGVSTVTGEFTLRRSDFGIGGGEWNEGDIVANEVAVRFRLVLAPAR